MNIPAPYSTHSITLVLTGGETIEATFEEAREMYDALKLLFGAAPAQATVPPFPGYAPNPFPNPSVFTPLTPTPAPQPVWMAPTSVPPQTWPIFY